MSSFGIVHNLGFCDYPFFSLFGGHTHGVVYEHFTNMFTHICLREHVNERMQRTNRATAISLPRFVSMLLVIKHVRKEHVRKHDVRKHVRKHDCKHLPNNYSTIMNGYELACIPL